MFVDDDVTTGDQDSNFDQNTTGAMDQVPPKNYSKK